MDRTLILLDCHPVALAQANCPQEIDLPPCSLWTCLVEGTIEYCRVVLDVCAPEAAVSVQAAGLPPSRSTLNTWDASEQSITQIFNAFGNVSPRSVSPSPTRLPSALETGFGTLAERDLEVVDTEDALPTKKQWNRGRVVLVLWAKARDEDGYSYRETLSDAKTDLRVMIYHALEKARKPRTPEYEPLHHVEVNIIRIYPEIALDENLPEDLPMQEVCYA
ncbi:hypothetical protein BC936DRAFT_144975 [Jimgerdemannia flammicorona]|uniref:Uncharacterized protein n=1 Tax=Jimgerdemannia flammicorona TaxID=994334 RepID=A0A433DB76_9FUNG|nr:hypothetical protein BC936DRAFT_144975 [Jimgerdemannia flammicorona]